MAHKKNRSFLQRLFHLGGKQEEESVATVAGKAFQCLPLEDHPTKFGRFRLQGGNLVPVDSNVFDDFESCMAAGSDIA